MKREDFDHRYREVLQRGEGLRLHLARAGRRRLRPLLQHPGQWLQVAQRRRSRRVRRWPRPQRRGSSERPRPLTFALRSEARRTAGSDAGGPSPFSALPVSGLVQIRVPKAPAGRGALDAVEADRPCRKWHLELRRRGALRSRVTGHAAPAPAVEDAARAGVLCGWRSWQYERRAGIMRR
jgi:hypothetical protein